ncbi:hypothetical protein HDV05_002124, partial [Chytridiales sp. JEL 0842]
LNILVILIASNEIGEKFFNESNLVETWKLIFNILLKGESADILDSVNDLMKAMLAHSHLKASFAKYITETSSLNAVVRTMKANPEHIPHLLHLISTILENSINIASILNLILESDLITLSLNMLAAQCPQPSDGPDGGFGLMYSCEFLEGIISTMESATSLDKKLSKSLEDNLHSALRFVSQALSDSLKQAEMPRARLSLVAMLELCEVAERLQVSITESQPRKEDLGLGYDLDFMLSLLEKMVYTNRKAEVLGDWRFFALPLGNLLSLDKEGAFKEKVGKVGVK